jgi:hypothetical protein
MYDNYLALILLLSVLLILETIRINTGKSHAPNAFIESC